MWVLHKGSGSSACWQPTAHRRNSDEGEGCETCAGQSERGAARRASTRAKGLARWHDGLDGEKCAEMPKSRGDFRTATTRIFEPDASGPSDPRMRYLCWAAYARWLRILRHCPMAHIKPTPLWRIGLEGCARMARPRKLDEMPSRAEWWSDVTPHLRPRVPAPAGKHVGFGRSAPAVEVLHSIAHRYPAMHCRRPPFLLWPTVRSPGCADVECRVWSKILSTLFVYKTEASASRR